MPAEIEEVLVRTYVTDAEHFREDVRDLLLELSGGTVVVARSRAGLGMDLTRVVVSAPEDPPRLESYGDDGPTSVTASMADLSLDAPYVGTVCALTSGSLAVRQHRGAHVLQQVTAWRAQAP